MKLHRMLAAMMATAMLPALALLNAPSASAAPPKSEVRMLKATGPDIPYVDTPNCIQQDDQNKLSVVLCDHSNPYQRWYVYRANVKGKPFKFRNQKSNLCMNFVINENRLRPDDAGVGLTGCNNDSTQTFWARGGNPKYPGNKYKIQSRANTNYWYGIGPSDWADLPFGPEILAVPWVTLRP